MKLTDYMAVQIGDPRKNLYQRWKAIAWAFWAHLVKPERFMVEGEGEPLELNTQGGQLLRLFGGLLIALTGLLQAAFSLLACVWLVVLLLLSPLLMLGIHVAAKSIVWRNKRRRAKLLAEARAAMEPRQS